MDDAALSRSLQRPLYDRIHRSLRAAPVAVTRQRIYAIIDSADPNDGASRIADIGIVSLIVLNVLAVILESVNSISQTYSTEFY